MSERKIQLLGPIEIRQLAEELDLNPTKKLGQNFVHDPNTVRKIVKAADVTASDTVVEIGPGLGSLTLALLETGASVTAVEIDPRLAERLPATLVEQGADDADVAVILKDAMTVTVQDFVDSGRPLPTALVANLPYNVSVPVLLHMLEEFPTIDRVLVMVQLEVADRLAAVPGSKIYGVPSVKAGFYGSVSRAATIGKNVFWPAPKIDSGLVRIDRYADGEQPWAAELLNREQADREQLDREQLRREVFALADAAFLQRRKTLRAALSGHFGGGQAAEQALRDSGIDPTLRGEKLSTEQFVQLAVTSLRNAPRGAQ
ncbi:16S rRNA (adenine(1518)-N(6)/adenine(1519)-N(6))-dimethyltransferase RsmA [Corynebacterium macclintockiae]|uniref:16S rRNA (adenine(1518)-N(6)/adenine(1519)-N(6))- dimethyltransferase RsmA n=1 Tax=Corynebacterium macclintockiae TaxID=2913501 RepID=UPI00254C821E|nr:16S rRNA (adenine(1518)-N(6)/adenine(1519)-N(6))-dimethyltransferase RsmA [Corynebacterium macclintockiae]MDK8891380.1 16S rRNA (adenine(1518)-N(6)/adenine(1519)-N(6))-dimethyltransferase RsmA [Corynebacterium macclintockiae]